MKETTDRIMSNFHWSGITCDISRFRKSHDICQRTIPKGRVSKIPLGTIPLMEEPFCRVTMDLIGPLSPVSDKGNRCILTIVNYTTRYPEAIVLPKIKMERITEALLEVFSRVGLPQEVLSDRGTQFILDLMKEVCQLIAMKQLFMTPYNPR